MENAEGVSGSLYDSDKGRVDAYLMLQKLFLFSKHANRGLTFRVLCVFHDSDNKGIYLTQEINPL